MFMLIKSIIYFISSAAIIPFIATTVYLFIRRLILFFSVAYNQEDCKILYDVILAFNNIFKDLFKINILDSPTLPSLAYKLFSQSFLKDELELTFSEEYVDYKEAYRGGAVDVYRPHGFNLKCYDVNSLYPYVMQSKPYPIGFSKYFRGSIFSLNDIFGIVKCNIIAPDIYAPILLTKTADGRIIAPTGS